MNDTRHVLSQRITDALAAPVPALTRRDVRLPAIPGKAHVVIGMRRSKRVVVGEMTPNVGTP